MKIFCIGRNYAAHAAEMGSNVPENPMVFMKPPTALLIKNRPFYYPDFSNDIHYEVEIVLRIGKNGKHIDPEFAESYIDAVGLGIDFTARDLQATCKAKGHPWEIAKGFDSSAVISEFIPVSEIGDLNALDFSLRKNGETVQFGNTSNMIFDHVRLITHLSRFFKLQVGDYIYTGTPEGVGPVMRGDLLTGYLGERQMLSCEVR